MKCLQEYGKITLARLRLICDEAGGCGPVPKGRGRCFRGVCPILNRATNFEQAATRPAISLPCRSQPARGRCDCHNALGSAVLAYRKNLRFRYFFQGVARNTRLRVQKLWFPQKITLRRKLTWQSKKKSESD